MIKKIYSFIKKIDFNPFKKKKKEKKEIIFILHPPPRSSYDMRKNFSKRGHHRVHFPKIFLNNYSTKHLKKNLLLKNFKPRLLYEGKSKEVKDPILKTAHPALRRLGDVAAMSFCTSQWRRRYVSNEIPNEVSMERRQDVSVVCLHDILLERHNDVSKGRNSDAPSLRLHDVSNKS